MNHLGVLDKCQLLLSWQKGNEIFFLILDEFCDGYPHNFTPTPGYWIECSRQSGRNLAEEDEEDEQQQEEDEEEDDDLHHRITEEGSQEDDEGVVGGSSSSGRKDSENAIKKPINSSLSGGVEAVSSNGGSATTVSSNFNTSTDTDRTGGASGRRVQLVHQHIQVINTIQKYIFQLFIRQIMI